MNEAPRVVVDSSVAVKWLLTDGEDRVADALAIRDAHERGDVVLTAPSYILLEILNALRSRGSDAISLSAAARVLLRAHLELAPVEDLAPRAAEIAVTHGLTVYDAAFVALAESLDAELVTADRRLAACPACRTRLLGA
jgi:predicted nucleic acid-binding protein